MAPPHGCCGRTTSLSLISVGAHSLPVVLDIMVYHPLVSLLRLPSTRPLPDSVCHLVLGCLLLSLLALSPHRSAYVPLRLRLCVCCRHLLNPDAPRAQPAACTQRRAILPLRPGQPRGWAVGGRRQWRRRRRCLAVWSGARLLAVACGVGRPHLRVGGGNGAERHRDDAV